MDSFDLHQAQMIIGMIDPAQAPIGLAPISSAGGRSSKGGGLGEEEEEFITSGNWRGKQTRCRVAPVGGGVGGAFQ